MSFGLTAATWLAIGSIASVAVGAGAAVYNANASRKAQDTAQDQAKAQAATTQAQATNATNRANAQGPDSASMLSSAMLAGQSGQGSTMLTGSQGIDPSQLSLGKSSLLGG